MKRYIATLCFISAASALFILGSGSLAIIFWSIGFLAMLLALALFFVHHKKA